jgi:hypothetical protein
MPAYSLPLRSIIRSGIRYPPFPGINGSYATPLPQLFGPVPSDTTLYIASTSGLLVFPPEAPIVIIQTCWRRKKKRKKSTQDCLVTVALVQIPDIPGTPC